MARIEIPQEALRFMTERYTSCYAFLESQQYSLMDPHIYTGHGTLFTLHSRFYFESEGC